MDRRRFLQYGTAAGITAVVAGGPLAAWARAVTPPAVSVASRRAYVPVPEFPSGVMSGDPSDDGVILWTRIAEAVAGAGVDVDWEVATDPGFGEGTVVASGTETTAGASGHTVRVEVAGLGAASTAWYRFTVGGATSPVGRTRTLPSGSVDRLRIAYFSCQRYVHGFYTAHADLASLALDPATDVDVVVSLGDYVYESGPADDVTVDGRVNPKATDLSLEDFRRQYDLYRSDPNLQAVHAAYPVVGIFDNHDGMRDRSDDQGPGAVAAFFEQMPVRRIAGDPTRQHRSLRFGDLAELFLLDERQHRDPEPPSGPNALGTTTMEEPSMVAPGRTMLGSAQLRWLKEGLAGSNAAWKVLGGQLMFAPLRSERFPDEQDRSGGQMRNAGRYVNMTQWDGYQAERQEILDHLQSSEVADVVAIAGDTHFWTTSEVPTDWDDPDAPYVLTEFGGSSVTSANAGEMADLPGNDLIRPVVAAANPLSLRFMEVTTHGYGLIDLTPARATVTYRSPATTAQPTSDTGVLARFEVDRGVARVRHVEGDGFMPRTVLAPTPGGGPGTDGDGRAAAPARPISGTPTFTG